MKKWIESQSLAIHPGVGVSHSMLPIGGSIASMNIIRVLIPCMRKLGLFIAFDLIDTVAVNILECVYVSACVRACVCVFLYFLSLV